MGSHFWLITNIDIDVNVIPYNLDIFMQNM
jgi:hypothetical protein